MPKKFRLTAPKGKKKGKAHTSNETSTVPQSLSVLENEDICVSRVSGVVINSFTQTDIQQSESTQGDDKTVTYVNGSTQTDYVKASYVDRSTQTDDVQASYVDGSTQTDCVQASYIDGSTQTDYVQASYIDGSARSDSNEKENFKDNNLVPQLDVHRTVPPSITQVEEFSVVDEVQCTDRPAYSDNHDIVNVEYQTPNRPQTSVEDEDDDVEAKICIGNNDEEFLPLIRKHKGIFKNVSGKTCSYILCTEAVTS